MKIIFEAMDKETMERLGLVDDFTDEEKTLIIHKILEIVSRRAWGRQVRSSWERIRSRMKQAENSVLSGNQGERGPRRQGK